MSNFKKNLILASLAALSVQTLAADIVVSSDTNENNNAAIVQQTMPSTERPYDPITVLNDASAGNSFMQMSQRDQADYVKTKGTDTLQNMMYSLQVLTTKYTSYTAEQINDQMMIIFKRLYPEADAKWEYVANWNYVKIYQDDDLVNYELYDTRSLNSMNNRTRIQRGLAPIGGDGQPVEVCVMSTAKGSSYVELLGSEVAAFDKAIYLNQTPDNACLRGKVQQDYWLMRQHDFVDNYLNYTARYKYTPKY